MRRHQNHSRRRVRDPAYREVFQRLDVVLAENTRSDNTEKIRLLRLALFADVDALQPSGTAVIPE